MRNKGVVLMPETDAEYVKAKHWLISRNKDYRVIYVPIDGATPQPVIISVFNWVDRLLYRLTFHTKTDKLNVYIV